MPARTIIIGDVHGCADELRDLLSAVAHNNSDALVFVGDLVVRGPKPQQVVKLARQLAARSVRGNHEYRLLRHRELHGDGADAAQLSEQQRRMLKSKPLRKAARALSPRSWSYLEEMPLWLDLPEHQARIVHAGLAPDVAIEKQQPTTLMFARCIDASGEPNSLRDSGPLWGSLYRGPPHVVFGHNALSHPQLHPWATGLDTGCVYGGRLTALVLEANASIPSDEAERRSLLFSVPARETYVPIR